MLTAIRQWVIRTMMKSKGETGIVQTMPKRDLVELNTQITAQRLMQSGIDPNTLKNANQVENAIIAIENKQKANLAENIRGGIKDTETAKIFNTAGEELDPNQPIIGGTQPGKKIDQDTFRRLAETNTQRIKQRISDKKVETDAEIKARLDKGNKEAAQKIRMKKMVKDAVDNVSPGFVKGDRKYNAQLVAEELAEKKFGKEFYDLDQRQQMDLYDEALDGLSVDLEDFAQGGRAGFKMGRRAFLKLMGGVGAGIGTLKSGLLKLTGKEAAPQVAKEVVEQTTKSTPPPYFFELANKIKTLGKPDKVTYADRVEIHRYTGKNGDEYELVEDLSTGDMKITKDKPGMASSGEETYDVINDRSVMEYKKGDVNVDPDAKTASKAPDEYDEYKVEFDVDGTEAEADDMSEFIRKEIIEEANQQAPKIKKAGGGIARVGYFLGSGRQAGTALIREILKYFNRDQKISVSEMLRTFNTRELRKLLNELSTYRKFDVKESGMPMPQILEDRIKKLNVGKEKVLESVLSAANAARKLDADMALRQNEMIEATVKQGFSREEAKELVEGLTTAIEKSQIQAGGPPKFKTATDEGIMDIEMMLKDLKTQGNGRKLNASGGLAGMLGE